MTSRGSIQCLLWEGSYNIKTPCLRGISITRSPWFDCCVRQSLQETFLVTSVSRPRWSDASIHRTLQSQSIFCLDKGKQCPGVLDMRGSPSSTSWGKSASEGQTNRLSLHTRQLHSAPVRKARWPQPDVCHFVPRFSMDKARLFARFHPYCKSPIYSFFLIDNILQRIKSCMQHGFVKPRCCSQWR
jgi:hypothetical protein